MSPKHRCSITGLDVDYGGSIAPGGVVLELRDQKALWASLAAQDRGGFPHLRLIRWRKLKDFGAAKDFASLVFDAKGLPVLSLEGRRSFAPASGWALVLARQSVLERKNKSELRARGKGGKTLTRTRLAGRRTIHPRSGQVDRGNSR